MTNRPLKRVLVVDDEPFICNDLRDEFKNYNDRDGSFTFAVDIAGTILEAIDKVRASQAGDRYDVLVLDLAFDPSGNYHEALALCRRLGQAIPVEIIFSGHADIPVSVQAMRYGAWDVIEKRDTPEGASFRRVVDSAVARLEALDRQQALKEVALEWLQRHIRNLQNTYGGQFVAIWHEPELGVVAAGRDVFELEMALGPWRQGRPLWMYPFVTRIPGTSPEQEL